MDQEGGGGGGSDPLKPEASKENLDTDKYNNSFYLNNSNQNTNPSTNNSVCMDNNATNSMEMECSSPQGNQISKTNNRDSNKRSAEVEEVISKKVIITRAAPATRNTDNSQRYFTNTVNNRYKTTDEGPYYVNIEGTTGDIGKLHRMSFGKWVYQSTFKYKDEILNITVTGKNRLRIEMKSARAANNIITLEVFKEKNVIAYIPNYLITVNGVIRGVDRDLEELEILECMQSPIKPIAVRRITKKAIVNNRQIVEKLATCVGTFDSQILPTHVAIYGARCAVEPYVPPLRQCRNCLRFRHSEDQCRSRARCENCAGDHRSGECQVDKLDSLVCVHCNGNHKATSRDCPVRVMQNNSDKEKVKGRKYSEVVTANRFELLREIDQFPEIETSNATMSTYRRPKTLKNTSHKNKINLLVKEKSKSNESKEQIEQKILEGRNKETDRSTDHIIKQNENNKPGQINRIQNKPRNKEYIEHLRQLIYRIQNETFLNSNSMFQEIGSTLENILKEYSQSVTTQDTRSETHHYKDKVKETMDLDDRSSESSTF